MPPSKRNKNYLRPRKGSTEKERRFKAQRRRLVALGLSEAEVNKLNAPQLRALLRSPKKLKA